ncbi:hypothetical protein [Thermoflavimicrobium dichotomicum]|uniref:HEAT repeat-containing protein n=1 Tax=Thermoflavimicrobium dichotomicum TaxID=46223 RepID=A0A1I3UCU0_9BACL|nr:hypothetical protein [Thermoflavimicrobium dichotomicum]SFJ81338.1 hypothetical protein SAMN05421852_12410 [Thermoflavimicrobium dichotomicum]
MWNNQRESELKRKRKVTWQKEEKICTLPEHLQELLDQNNPKFIDELVKFAFYFSNSQEDQSQSGAWLWSLYLDNHPLKREGLLRLLTTYNQSDFYRLIQESGVEVTPSIKRTEVFRYSKDSYCLIPLTKKLLPYIERIFQLAEKRKDASIWGKIAYMFDHEFEQYKWIAMSSRTRKYLQRCAWRTLRELGEQGTSDYVLMASEILLCYHENDFHINWVKEEDPLHPLPNWYKNFLPKRNQYLLKKILICHHSDSPNHWWLQDQLTSSLFKEEVEAFPELWNQHPEQLFRLVCKARSPFVIQFAIDALKRGNQKNIAHLPLRDLLDLLEHGTYNEQKTFAMEVILKQMDPKNPDVKLLLTLMKSPYPFRRHVITFIESNITQWSDDLLDRLLTGWSQITQYPNSIEWEQIIFEQMKRRGVKNIDLQLLKKIIIFGNSEYTKEEIKKFVIENHDEWTEEQKTWLLEEILHLGPNNYFMGEWLLFFQGPWERTLRRLISIDWAKRYLHCRYNYFLEPVTAMILHQIDLSIHPYRGIDLFQFLRSNSKIIREKAQEILLKDADKLQLDAYDLAELASTSVPIEQEFVKRFFDKWKPWLEPQIPTIIDCLRRRAAHPDITEEVSTFIHKELLEKVFRQERDTTPLLSN